jgi:hypothetical protein
MGSQRRLWRAQYSRVEELKVSWKVCAFRKLVLLILWNIWLESFSSSCAISLVHEYMAR